MMTVVVLVGCAGSGKPGRSDLLDPRRSTNDDKRIIRYEPGQISFEHSLEVRHSKAGVTHELHDGDTVTNGDRMRVSITTYEAAHLYLAFCADRELVIFPSQRGVLTTAGTNMQVPGGDSELVIAGDPGAEVLYVIVSRDELSLADPHLAQTLAASRGSEDVDCAGLDAELATPAGDDPAKRPGSTTTTNVLHGKVVQNKPQPASTTRDQRDAPEPGHGSWTATGSGASPIQDHAHPPVDPGAGRNSEEKIVWYGDPGIHGRREVISTDADGIAVVRYRFKHEAPRPVP